ncbi:MAG: carbon-nitrogen hydrolase family protein [Maricaulaceae bacterium]
MRVGIVQLCSGLDIDANIETASKFIRSAAADGASMVVTPEMTHLLQSRSSGLMDAVQPQDTDKGVAHFSKLAKELGVNVLIGSLAVKNDDTKALNRSFLFGKEGEIKAVYDKIHLFDIQLSRAETYAESKTYKRGEAGVTVDVEGTKVGMSICYDVRFPGLYRDYANSGAEIMAIPSAFTRPTGEAHWEILLRARAIETGSFIVAPAQGGKHEDGRATWGRSMIVGPWGEIRVRLDHDEPGYVCAKLDTADVAMARRKIPAWQHNPDYT